MNSRSGELAVTSDATEGSEGSLKSQYPKISSSWDREVVTDKNINKIILSVFVGSFITVFRLQYNIQTEMRISSKG